MVSPTTKHLRSQTVCLTWTLSVLLLSFNPKLLQGSMALELPAFCGPFTKISYSQEWWYEGWAGGRGGLIV